MFWKLFVTNNTSESEKILKKSGEYKIRINIWYGVACYVKSTRRAPVFY